jgi:hypothetical protein
MTRQATILGPLLFAISGAVGAGCSGAPPCQVSSPPTWTAPANLCTLPPGTWTGSVPAAVSDGQKGAEWLMYDAELVFNGLSPSDQAKYLTKFTDARTAFIASDQTFVAAVETVIQLGQQDFSAALAQLAVAVQSFVAAVNEWGALTSSDGKPKFDDFTQRAAKIGK